MQCSGNCQNTMMHRSYTKHSCSRCLILSLPHTCLTTSTEAAVRAYRTARRTANGRHASTLAAVIGTLQECVRLIDSWLRFLNTRGVSRRKSSWATMITGRMHNSTRRGFHSQHFTMAATNEAITTQLWSRSVSSEHSSQARRELLCQSSRSLQNLWPRR